MKRRVKFLPTEANWAELQKETTNVVRRKDRAVMVFGKAHQLNRNQVAIGLAQYTQRQANKKRTKREKVSKFFKKVYKMICKRKLALYGVSILIILVALSPVYV